MYIYSSTIKALFFLKIWGGRPDNGKHAYIIIAHSPIRAKTIIYLKYLYKYNNL